jgi:hypothetical protein
MVGDYRTEAVLAKLPGPLASAIRDGLRIGLANQPMAGVTLRRDMAEDMAKAFEAAGENKYARGLRGGTMMPLVPHNGPDRYWAPGELFFTS